MQVLMTFKKYLVVHPKHDGEEGQVLGNGISTNRIVIAGKNVVRLLCYMNLRL